MHYIEYDEMGVATEHEVSMEDYYLTSSQRERIEAAKLELVSSWGASESGSKQNPDNAHGLFFIFWARPLEPVTRRIVPVRELGGFWRRGVGVRLGGRVLGLWGPWRRPPRPVLDTPERMDVSPAELVGEAA